MLRRALADPGWTRESADRGRDDATTDSYQWHHSSLVKWLAEAERPPNWDQYLDADDPVVATNAAILLARQGDSSVAHRLALAVQSRSMKLPVRLAAADTLAGLPTNDVRETLHALVELSTTTDTAETKPYVPEVQAELLRGLARHSSPAEDSRFEQATRSASPVVRLAALEAWSLHPSAEPPPAVVDLRFDADWRVRSAALELIGARRAEGGLTFLLEGLRDFELAVRLSAVRGLGSHGGEEAQRELATLLEHRSDRIRAASIEALAEMASAGNNSARVAVLGAADDRGWRVRQSVARVMADPSLAARLGADGHAAMTKLLTDSSPLVQTQAVETLTNWPLESAASYLLDAMQSSTYQGRRAAAEHLASLWPPAREFSPDAPAPRREKTLAGLRNKWFELHPETTDASATAHASAKRFDPFESLPEEELAKVESILARLNSTTRDDDDENHLIEELERLGPHVLDLLEHSAVARQQRLPDAVTAKLLPRHDEVYDVIRRLTEGDTRQRRRAAAQLAQIAEDDPLRPLGVAVLAQRVEGESDPQVWQSVFRAIAEDEGEASIYLAYVAVGHGSPEVRRQGCMHLARHPDARHFPVLLPVIDDSHVPVVRSATIAISESRAADSSRALMKLLRHDDRVTRIEAARGLARLGEPGGIDALERLARDSDPAIRLRAVEIIGELEQFAFAPVLIQTLEDSRTGVRRAALRSLVRVVGRDVAAEAQPAGATAAARPSSVDEAIERWRLWWNDEGSAINDGTLSTLGPTDSASAQAAANSR